MSQKRGEIRTPLRSLVLLPFASNPGYAITALESLFYDITLELACGDHSLVHFGYANFDLGRPTCLPAEHANLIEYDIHKNNPDDMARVERYVKDHGIQLVLFFDVEITHSIIRRLRRAGASTLLSYYGAPVAYSMPWWKRTIKRVQVALFTSKLDGLIFESVAMAHTATYGRGVPSTLVDIIPLGVDTERYRPARSRYVYDAFGFPDDRKVVIYSGHMERRKGLQTLVEAAVELLENRKRKDVSFLVCGNRNEEECREYKALYRGKGIDDFIRFGGYRSDLDELFPSCFCGVIPSTGWDSFPRSSLEMASAGLPVVASRLGGLPETISDKETGLLFEPGDARGLADCLEQLLNDPALAARMGSQGRTRCEKHFTVAIQGERLLSCIQRRLIGSGD